MKQRALMAAAQAAAVLIIGCIIAGALFLAVGVIIELARL